MPRRSAGINGHFVERTDLPPTSSSTAGLGAVLELSRALERGGGGWRGAHQRGGSRLRSGWLLAPSSSGGARVSGSSEQSAGVLPGISRPPEFSQDPSVWETEGDTLRGEVSPGMEVDSSWAGPTCRKSLLSRTCWKWRHSGRWWAVRCLLPFPGLAKHLEGSVHS